VVHTAKCDTVKVVTRSLVTWEVMPISQAIRPMLSTRGSVTALSRLCHGSVTALSRLCHGSVTALTTLSQLAQASLTRSGSPLSPLAISATSPPK
jgi:hypothetical protein